MYQYCRRLETAIRESTVFPQVQKRVSDLEQEEGKDDVFRRKKDEELRHVTLLDDLERQV